MYKLEFTLQQHTPLIHFQHDQAGATLRATEVKPKLDQFIIEKLLKEQDVRFDYYELQDDGRQKFITAREAFSRCALNSKNDEQKKWASWLVGKGNNEHVALDYKLKIFSGENIQRFIIASRLGKNQPQLLKEKGFEVIYPSPYFSQEKEIAGLFKKRNPDDKNSDFTYANDFEKSISQFSKIGIIAPLNICQANSQNGEILEIIEKYCCEFFIVENFGTRNNKGFGSFTIESINRKKVSIEPLPILRKQFDFVYSKDAGKSLSDTFSLIQMDYKLMKAGRGRHEGYAKSVLFQYFAEDRIRWEKRWLKQQIKPFTSSGKSFYGYDLKQEYSTGDPIDINLLQNWDDKKLLDDDGNPLIADYMYIRALLGLAESFDFQTNDNSKKVHVKIISNGDLERFKSPVLFKIIENKIYLVGLDSIPTNFLHDNSPTFEVYKKINEKVLKDSQTILSKHIKIPNEFSLSDFARYCFEYDKSERLVRISGFKNEKSKHYE
jgi:hypothetical protein